MNRQCHFLINSLHPCWIKFFFLLTHTFAFLKYKMYPLSYPVSRVNDWLLFGSQFVEKVIGQLHTLGPELTYKHRSKEILICTLNKDNKIQRMAMNIYVCVPYVSVYGCLALLCVVVRQGALGAMAPQRRRAASREVGQFSSPLSSSPCMGVDSRPSGHGSEGSGCCTAHVKRRLAMHLHVDETHVLYHESS